MAANPTSDLKTFVRNNYYYGKLLDADHFELETNYANGKRWLLNRHLLGHGVVCGLGVLPGDTPNSIRIKKGVGLDWWGRELVVPKDTDSIPVPPELLPPPPSPVAPAPAPTARPAAKGTTPTPQPQFTDLHVVLCDQECMAAPTPVLTADCQASGPCMPGEIREQFRVEIRDGAAPRVSLKCRIPDVFRDGQIDYGLLTRFVTNNLHEPPKNPCIVLANLRIPQGAPAPCKAEQIDMTVRRIVYSNELLFDLILGLANASSDDNQQ
jgi:hypothetical protein